MEDAAEDVGVHLGCACRGGVQPDARYWNIQHERIVLVLSEAVLVLVLESPCCAAVFEDENDDEHEYDAIEIGLLRGENV